MLIDFFLYLRDAKLPVSIREFLDLLRALQRNCIICDVNHFYSLARICLVKDERHFDRFDRAFSAYFDGVDSVFGDELLQSMIPEEWLRKQIEKVLSKEQMQSMQSLGDLEKLVEEFHKRLQEQQKRHEGGNKWIGTGGTSPFGAFGFNPAGFRIGGQSTHKQAVKVWEQRQYRDLDESIELGTRHIKIALRRLRRMARTGSSDILDVDQTIRSTASRGGLLDIHMMPERHNNVKVLLFFDVGGSMDPFIDTCEQLFAAAHTEFKHMEYFYFHNCVYETLWKNNQRRQQQRFSTWDIIHKYASDYKIIFVGDAAMSPYELVSVGGSVEHWNEESGEVWLRRLLGHFNKAVWLNPEIERSWEYVTTTTWIKKLMEDRMYPLTLQGLEKGIEALM